MSIIGGGMGSWAALATGDSFETFCKTMRLAGSKVIEVGIFQPHGSFEEFVNGTWMKENLRVLNENHLVAVGLAIEIPGGSLALTDDPSAHVDGITRICDALDRHWYFCPKGGPKDIRVDTTTFPEHFTEGVANPGNIIGTPQPVKVDFETGTRRIFNGLKQMVGAAAAKGYTLHLEMEPGFAPSSLDFTLELARQTGVKVLLDLCHAYAVIRCLIRQINGHVAVPRTLCEGFELLKNHVEWIHCCNGNGTMTDLGGGLITSNHLCYHESARGFDAHTIAQLCATYFPKTRILDTDYCGNQKWQDEAVRAREFLEEVMPFWG